MAGKSEGRLLDRAFEHLRDLIADADGLEMRRQSVDPTNEREAAWELASRDQSTLLLAEAFEHFAPRDVDRVARAVSPSVRNTDPPVVVVAPWLSPRSREVLTDRGFNYVDLTGNVRLKVNRPMVRLRTDGAQRDPAPAVQPVVQLRGASVNALVRILVDVRPPFRMVDLARATGLSNAYVSRTLDALHEQNLIERSARSRLVTDVDWPALLRARAVHYKLLKSNEATTFVSRSGPRALHEAIATSGTDQTVVTGSFAVAPLVQVATPTQLVLYVADTDEFARGHGLIPSTRAADVALLRAADGSQLSRTRPQADGTFHVGLSQLALDCLGGNGRLPEEGDALIAWMSEPASNWRLEMLPG